nr:PREDICTED: uncharacterized protein LOC107982817 [Anolis carolinensis]|eukprot:XP_016848938.1 PREDICTED: uncharacterized protein LOC107982817 [Anolis carolinensis]
MHWDFSMLALTTNSNPTMTLKFWLQSVELNNLTPSTLDGSLIVSAISRLNPFGTKLSSGLGVQATKANTSLATWLRLRSNGVKPPLPPLRPIVVPDAVPACPVSTFGTIAAAMSPLQPSVSPPLHTCLFTDHLAPFYHQWESITLDTWVLCIVQEGYALEFEELPPTGHVSFTNPSPEIYTEIDYLLAKGAIQLSPSEQDPRSFFSRYFTIPKRKGGSSPHPGLACAELVHSSNKIPDGIHRIHSPNAPARRLLRVYRLMRCVFPHCDTKGPQMFYLFQGPRPDLPAYHLTLRPRHGTESLHQGSGRGCGTPQTARHHGLSVSGRLASCRT